MQSAFLQLNVINSHKVFKSIKHVFTYWYSEISSHVSINLSLWLYYDHRSLFPELLGRYFIIKMTLIGITLNLQRGVCRATHFWLKRVIPVFYFPFMLQFHLKIVKSANFMLLIVCQHNIKIQCFMSALNCWKGTKDCTAEAEWAPAQMREESCNCEKTAGNLRVKTFIYDTNKNVQKMCRSSNHVWSGNNKLIQLVTVRG